MILGDGTEVRVGNTYGQGEVGDKKGSKEMDRCPLTEVALTVSQPSRVKLGVPSNIDGDRAQGCTFLTSCELYISLTASDFVDEQVCIHWALSYFKGGHTVSFAECILRQELTSGKMCFASWSNFMEEFVSVFCPENEATTALMRLESNHYFQGKWNVEAYINKFKDLINLSGYRPSNPSHKPAIAVARPVTLAENATSIMMSTI
jgi:hypothetical protein